MSKEIELTEKHINKFWSLVDIRGSNDCWLWTGGKFSNGYGRMKIKKQAHPAHRIAFVIANGRQIKDGLVVAHAPIICHNPLCCNPAHLSEKTIQDNALDMILDGTIATGKRNGAHTRPGNRVHLFGERNGSAKLSSSQVREIRSLYRDKKYNQYQLAEKFGVGQSLINQIIKNKIWTKLQ